MNFSSLPLSAALLQVVEELGFTSLTPIQAQSIPIILEGKDLIGQSKTGSGKTAAFALPILEAVRLGGSRRIQALILCPTRELCTQVAREMRKLGRRHPDLQILILSGGQPIGPQRAALEKGAHVVVGTPGRLLDHLSQETLDLRFVRTLVLDEADRMLEMGFQEDMETILAATPKSRQTIFFSATFPERIDALSATYQRDPIRVTIADEPQNAPDIRQIYYETPYELKEQALLGLLWKHQPESAIVFCNLKATANDLVAALQKTGASAAALHGDLEQWDRDLVMTKFRNKSVRVLVATDVAARGIDVESLPAVFNFDLPSKAEVYVHRIGRTGRAGRKGLAISLATPREQHKIKNIESEVGFKLERKSIATPADVPVPIQDGTASLDAPMATLYLGAGRKDKLRPGDILGALTGEAGGLNGGDVGKIEIYDRFSYVAVIKGLAPTVLKNLRDGRIKGRKMGIQLV